jgi:hypothetical protein
MPLASVVPLVVFVALMLLASLAALAASGHFPKASRLPALTRGFGPLILWLAMAVTATAFVAGAVAALMLLPWYAVVIGGGGAILLAPLVLQGFPDRIVDGRSALIGFPGGAALCAIVLCWLTRA